MTLKEDILRLRSEGKTYNEIRAELNCSKGTISYHVGDGQKEKTKERNDASRAVIKSWLREEKETNPCVDCHQFYPYWVMQFDHLPQFEKLFNLSNFHDYTKDLNVVKAERAKCDLVCGNCHTTRGHMRRHPTIDWADELFDDELG